MWRAGPARRGPAAGRPAARRPGFVLAPGMRVGLYGGSFDPVHHGHAHVSRTALIRLGLDRVIWLVAPRNPLKARRVNLARRLAEVEARARGPSMIVSDIEARLGGRHADARYTIDTVRWLRGRFPGVHFVWIMGADSLASLHQWKGWADLMAEIPVAVISRPGSHLRGRLSPATTRFRRGRWDGRRARDLALATPPAWIYLTAPFQSVSSSALRDSA